MQKEKWNGTSPPLSPTPTLHASTRHRVRRRSGDDPSRGPQDFTKPNGEANLLVNDQNKYKSMKTRVLSSLWMIGGFAGIIYMGHLYIWAMIVVIQLFMAQELFTLARAAQRAKNVPGFRFLNWHFFTTAMVYVYGRFLSKQLVKTISSDKMLLLIFSGLIQYHMIICYFMYIAGFVWFILTLKKGMYQYQFSQYAWTHMILFVVFAQSSFTVANIFEGIIWFLLPCSLIVINDIAAYFFGFYFGRTPLIKLSPKKTWEGFIGASVTTVLSGFLLAYLMGSSTWLTCPRKDLSTGWLYCDPGPMFKPKYYSLLRLSTWVRLPWKETSIMPVQMHAMALGLFASSIAPFGGFFASGFKRAFKIKVFVSLVYVSVSLGFISSCTAVFHLTLGITQDFGDSIPGHGGITDRMDCQMVMAVFSYTYYQSFVAPRSYSVDTLLTQILGHLSAEEQFVLYQQLAEVLTKREQIS